MDRSIIDRYMAQAGDMHRALDGLGHDEVRARPITGKWSVQELVVHVADADLVSIDRMKRVIAMPRPLLIGFDETAYAERLFYQEVDAAQAADMYRAGRRWMSDILRRLPDEAFERAGVHNERGLLTLEALIRTMIEHVDHHMRFADEKRAALGKPMAAGN